MSRTPLESLLTDMLRPKTMDELIAGKRIKSQLESGVTLNYIFTGPTGMGKTSAALILAGGKGSPNCMFLNGSRDGGKVGIIEEIDEFCVSKSIFSGNPNALKVIVVDEADGGTDKFFKGLRETVERYSKTTRFIFTCNNIEKIPQIMKTRFEIVDFSPMNTQESKELYGLYHARCCRIAEICKISYEPSDIDLLLKNRFPDLRSILNLFQSIYNNKNVDDLKTGLSSCSGLDVSPIISLCLSPCDPVKNYQTVMSEYQHMASDIIFSLSEMLVPHIINNVPEKTNCIPGVIITLADAQVNFDKRIDHSILLLSTIYKLQNILKS